MLALAVSSFAKCRGNRTGNRDKFDDQQVEDKDVPKVT